MSIFKILFFALFFISTISSFSQEKKDTLKEKELYIITKNDGVIYVGEIVYDNAREVFIKTKKTGDLIIPKHEIKSIVKARESEINAEGEIVQSEVFATRYFITTNAIPISKGESYILWNIYGPDFQFGLGKNVGVGIMSTWVGMPIIGTLKYSFSKNEKFHYGFGVLGGTGSWAVPEWGMILPFGIMTFGDKKANINFSAGYGAIIERGESDGRFLFSVAGFSKIGKKISVVLDSFIMPAGNYFNEQETNYNPSTGLNETIVVRKRKEGFALIIPGIRWQLEPNKAFQFGFAGLMVNGEAVPAPIPMIQWFRKL
jgi:hypothetical protein